MNAPDSVPVNTINVHRALTPEVLNQFYNSWRRINGFKFDESTGIGQLVVFLRHLNVGITSYADLDHVNTIIGLVDCLDKEQMTFLEAVRNPDLQKAIKALSPEGYIEFCNKYLG